MNDQPVKRPIYSSHLCLRFYEKDGWTKELLDSLCRDGSVRCFHPSDEPEWRYFTLDFGSAFDVDKLMAHMSELFRYPGYSENETDRDYIDDMNW